MATSLVISYPDITMKSVYLASQQATAADKGQENLISGDRCAICETGSANTSQRFTFGLGSNYAAKGGKADHIIIARADKLQSGLVTQLDVKRSTDNSTFTTEQTDASFSTATLYGPNAYDYVKDFTLSSAYEFWRVDFTSGAGSVFPMSKIFLGAWFDFGQEPDDFSIQRVPAKEATWMSSSGAAYSTRLELPIYRFSFSWAHVADSVVNSFQNEIARIAHRATFFLYTRAQHEVLGNQRLVNVRLVDWSVSNNEKINWNTLTATFEEILG